MRGKKAVHERNLREIYTENTTMFCFLSVFMLFLLPHNITEYEQIGGGGAQNFIAPRGKKTQNKAQLKMQKYLKKH
jgi:hypothetical protein